MGRDSSTPPPPPPPKAPPPPAEDISAEVITPTMRQEAARRARRGAYVTRGQRMGAGGQLLGAAPIQLANVRAAAQAAKSTPIAEAKTIETFDPTYTQKIESARSSSGKQSQRRKRVASRKSERQTAYDKYLKQRNKGIAARSNESISFEGGMII